MSYRIDEFIKNIKERSADSDVEVITSTLTDLLERGLGDIISDSNISRYDGNTLFDIASSHYREAISNKNDMSKIKEYAIEMSRICDSLEGVTCRIGNNFPKCHEFILDGLKRYESINRLVSNSDLIIRIISLFNQLEHALASRDHVRAYELIEFSERLENHFNDCTFISNKDSILRYKLNLHNLLCDGLKKGGGLSDLKGYVRLLKGLNISTEMEIRRVYIVNRSEIVRDKLQINDLDLERCLDILGGDVYDFIVFYRSLFGDLDGYLSSVAIDLIVSVLNKIKKFEYSLCKLLEISGCYSSLGMDFTCIINSIL